MGRRLCQIAMIVAFAAVSSPNAGGSSATAPGRLAPLETTLPSISGVPSVSQRLSTDPGTWDGPAITFSYLWARCDSTGSSCLTISGADAQSFIPTSAEIGSTLRVVVTAANKNGSAVATSNPTRVIAPPSTTPGTTTGSSTSTSTTTTSTTTTNPTTTTVASDTAVTSMTLVDADTNADIKTLVDGETLDLAKLPTRNLNVRANVSNATVVTFGLDAIANFRTERITPFALAGDSAGNYYPWTPTVGTHRIVATPFSASGATGIAGAVNITVTGAVNITVTDAAPASSGGSVLFRGDFETGGLNQWSDIQCANYGTTSSGEFTRGNVFAVSGLGGQSTYSARIDLPAASNKSACELGKGAPHPLGSDDYYSMEYKFPSNWVEPGGWGGTLNQLGFQYPPVWGATFSMNSHKDSVEAVVQGGSCLYGTGCSNTVHKNVIPVGTPLSNGVWQQFIVHQHWSTTDGVSEVWWRPKGGSWTKTVVVANGPTVQWAPNTAPITPNLDKQGFYRGASSVPLSIWMDGFCRATTFAAAESCL